MMMVMRQSDGVHTETNLNIGLHNSSSSDRY